MSQYYFMVIKDALSIASIYNKFYVILRNYNKLVKIDHKSILAWTGNFHCGVNMFTCMLLERWLWMCEERRMLGDNKGGAQA